MGKIAEIFRNKLLEIKNEEGFTSFSARSGIPQSRLSEWFTKQNPSVPAIEKVSEGLGIEPWQLIKPRDAAENRSPIAEDLLALLKSRDSRIRMLEARIQELSVLAENIARPSAMDDELIAQVRDLGPKGRSQLKKSIDVYKAADQDSAKPADKKSRSD